MREAVERARDGGTNLAFLVPTPCTGGSASTTPARARPGCRPATGTTRTSTCCATSARRRRPRVPRRAGGEVRADPGRHGVRVLPGRRRPHDRLPAAGGASAGRASGSATASPASWGLEADRVYLDESTPRPMQALSHTPYSCRGVATSSQAVYTRRARVPVSLRRRRCAGAAPWSTHASGRWVRACSASCSGSPTTPCATFADGPAGRRHPARDTVTRFQLPDVNRSTRPTPSLTPC